MKRLTWIAIAGAVLFLVTGALADETPGECGNGLCGTPNESGGSPCVDGVCSGGGCGCGSVLINNTDLGDTYQYSDDYDEDGIEDDFDNCPFLPNRDQADGDGDTVGDACDTCASVPDELQRDADGDGLGDVCDPDIDGDSVVNAMDSCPSVRNPTQADVDGDMLGDACDPDIDGDGIPNLEDNCPFVGNPDQLSTDPSRFGDACSSDIDVDGVQDFVDNCPLVYNPDQVDADGDLMGDGCDADMDDDQILNETDNCPRLVNRDQDDIDRDGQGDTCDDRFCYVVDRVDACLDPASVFSVYAGADRTVRTGETLPMLFWANRMNRGIEYEWSVVSRPSGSKATVKYPRGSSTLSTPYNYHYKKGRRAEFTADQPGEYVIKLSARLVFGDDIYPGKDLAEVRLTLTAEGDALTGCSTGGVGGLSGLWILAGFLALRRKLG